MQSINDIKDARDAYAFAAIQARAEQDMIQKAINSSYSLLSLNGFIRVTGYALPDVEDLGCIMQPKSHFPVLLTEKIVGLFGYKGKPNQQKNKLLDLIKSHKISHLLLNNEEYEEFSRANTISSDDDPEGKYDDISQTYPPSVNPNGRSIHILMLPVDIKKLLMMVKTEKGDLIRTFFCELIHVRELYMRYEKGFKSRLDARIGAGVDYVLDDIKLLRDNAKALRDNIKKLVESSRNNDKKLDNICNRLSIRTKR
jgi:hypothetical protein